LHNVYVTDEHGYIPFVVVPIPSIISLSLNVIMHDGSHQWDRN